MDVEERIAKIERLSVRVTLLGLLLLGLLVVLVYGFVEAVKFIWSPRWFNVIVHNPPCQGHSF